MTLTHDLIESHFNGTLVEIEWNSVDEVEYYNINISPPVDSKSTFTTPNNTIQLPVLYNQDYNISVVANNCAGNSAPAKINVRIGKLIILSCLAMQD